MKIVTFGGKGMVGSRVAELLGEKFSFINPSNLEVDITDNGILEEFLEQKKPQVVINFAAMTDVNACENERENKEGLVWKVNALAPGNLSNLSKKYKFFLIQISTDMVFAGSQEKPGPYAESHVPSLQNYITWYGASKAEGERLTMLENDKNAVVRIIYPVRAKFEEKLDYIRKIVSLYDEGKLYPMFIDQFINITFIDELALALEAIINTRYNGVFHVASNNMTTPYELASYLLIKARKVEGVIEKAKLSEFIAGKDKRRYPEFGGLRSRFTEEKLSLRFSSWQEIVDSIALLL